MPRSSQPPSAARSSDCFDHEVLAAVLQVRPTEEQSPDVGPAPAAPESRSPFVSTSPPADGTKQLTDGDLDGAEAAGAAGQWPGTVFAVHVLLWQRAQEPEAGHWALPGGRLGATEDLGSSIRRQLAEKVDVRELSHLEQLESLGDPRRVPHRRTLATSYLGLMPGGVLPGLPEDTRWHPADALPPMAFDHARIVEAARRRLRSKLSYTNLGFALAPPRFTMSELATYYRAALGHDVDATNLQRILLRRQQIVATGERLRSGPAGGRPAAVFRFRSPALQVTDAFAVLHPPR